MRIGEISRQTGFSTDTIRWYEKIGLIKPGKHARTENNYRIYSEDNRKRLLLIKRMKSFGFTLKEIEELFTLDEINLLNCNSAGEILENRLAITEQKIAELQAIKGKLLQVKTNCKGDCRDALDQETGCDHDMD